MLSEDPTPVIDQLVLPDPLFARWEGCRFAGWLEGLCDLDGRCGRCETDAQCRFGNAFAERERDCEL